MDEDKKHATAQPLSENKPVVRPSLRHAGGGKTSVKKPKSFRWDEKTIAEQDLDRGTRQKVDEPKTPYAGPAADPALPDLEGGSSFSLDANQGETDRCYRTALMSALLEAKDQEERGQPAFWDAPSIEEDDLDRQHSEFAEKRRKHYQMFK